MTTEEIRQWEQRKLAAIDALEEIEDNQARLAAGFDENGKKIIEDTKKAKDLAHELGLTFTSAFEDAVIAGKKFSDVLKSLAQDIAKIILRKTITEPLGKFISTSIEGIFKADGGPVSGGSPYIVGERGPELFVPNVSGGIVPNDALAGVGGGVTINQVIHFSANTPAASRDAVYAAAPMIVRQAVEAVRAERNRTGDRR
jgi:phage-related minor tail protein